MFHAAGDFDGWILSDEMDEIVPKCLASPDEWLVRAGETFFLVDPWAKNSGTSSERRVAEGDVISFSGRTRFDPIRFAYSGPDDYELLTPIPAGATLFWLKFDTDTIVPGFKEFVAVNAANGAFEPGEIVEVGCYDWSDADFVLRNGRFERVEAA